MNGSRSLRFILFYASVTHQICSNSYESTQRQVEIDIRVLVEFRPSYVWQRLHAWHTIPSGIETR